MDLLERLDGIIDILTKSDKPVSGTYLSEKFGVSRQIIVQDITRLREYGRDIISTPRGYVLGRDDEHTRVFKVYHTAKDTEKELNLIVDQGGEVRDVFIYHRVYGEIHAKLSIRSRRDARNFCEDIKSGKSSTLSSATGGYHYHTVVASDEETLIHVEKELSSKGFLAPLTDYEPEVLISQNKQ